MAVQDFLTDTGTTVAVSVNNLILSFVNFIPQLIGALFIILLGWIVGKVLKHVIVAVLERSSLDKWVEEQNLTAAIGGKKISHLVGSITKWYVIAIFLAQAVSTFNLLVLGGFLSTLAYYIPLFLVAVVIMAIALILARYVRHTVEATEYEQKHWVGVVLEIVIAYLGLVMALQNMGLRVDILLDLFRIAFTGFVLTIAIAVGLAFAFAFKDQAKDLSLGLAKEWPAKKGK